MTETALAYRVVDVFTDRAFGGNPLAVVLDGDDLTTAQMQALANEFNLSETTFPVAPTTPDATYKLRIFTPSTELPFAGHPSVGSAWVMRLLGRAGEGDVVQECGAGLLPLRFDGERVTLSGGPPHVGADVEAGPVLAAVGLTAADFVGHPVRWAGVGIDFGFLHVQPEAVDRAAFDTGRGAALPSGAGLSVFSYVDGEVHARVFAPGAGVAEDPATGSAALGLGVWLASCGLVDGDGETSYVITQGVEIGRPSRLECAVRCEAGQVVETLVTGRVVPVAEGRIRRPEA
jgi:trans-2,3-dihydro-3-hydroxyanthranilate isomerase